MPDPCAEALWCQRRGVGPPVLLLHGIGASSPYWDRVLEAVRDREVIAPDLLGVGRSPAPAGAAYDVDCHLRALGPLLQPGTLVVGHSTGGILAAALAAAHPELVSGLLLLGLPVYDDEAAARAGVARLGRLARLTVEEHPAARLLCQATSRVRPLAAVGAPIFVRDLPRSVAAGAARHTWASYSRTLRNVVVGHRVDSDLARVAAPVELLHGRADRTARLAPVEALRDRLADAGRPVVLEVVDGDHHLPVRRPDLVAQRIDGL